MIRKCRQIVVNFRNVFKKNELNSCSESKFWVCSMVMQYEHLCAGDPSPCMFYRCHCSSAPHPNDQLQLLTSHLLIRCVGAEMRQKTIAKKRLRWNYFDPGCCLYMDRVSCNWIICLGITEVEIPASWNHLFACLLWSCCVSKTLVMQNKNQT